ncbi:MAG: hypothetical protein V3U23_03935 [Kiloniellales bacterium]
MTGAEAAPPGAPDAPELPPATRRGALDGPMARVVALGVFVLAAAALGWFHRDDIFPPEAASLADDPAARCIAERWAGIDLMAAEGTIDAARAKLFKARAEAWCRSQAGQR